MADSTSQALQVVVSNQFPPSGSEAGALVSQFPGVRIRVCVICMEPLRAAGLHALFQENHAIEIVVPAAARKGSEVWMDPSVQIALIGTTAGRETVELIESIRLRRPELRMVLMSAAAGDDAILIALKAGAKGFLHETATQEQVEEAVRMVASGSVWAPRRVLSRLVDDYVVSRKMHATAAERRFTVRERQVMDLLLEGYANKDIASELKIEERTVKVYVARLMRKMGVENRTALSMRAVTLMRGENRTHSFR